MSNGNATGLSRLTRLTAHIFNIKCTMLNVITCCNRPYKAYIFNEKGAILNMIICSIINVITCSIVNVLSKY
jgi:hypothetical protein